MGSSFGTLFRISTFGESHGGGVGVIVDGCPPRLELDLDAIQAELDRRKPGQSRITTPRKEDDRVEILSGLLDGQTLGTPIAMVVRNKDQRPQDYQEMAVAFRPSHADATYQAKYGIQARSGGGRASARETIGRVAAGAIAKQLLAKAGGTEVMAWVQRIHTIEAQIDPAAVSLEAIESNAACGETEHQGGQRMTPCPMCGGHAPVIESRVCGNGSRRQRRACQGCGHRWTTHQGTPPQRCRNRLTAQEVERIIKTVDQLTAELNCSRGTVVSVLQRPETISCLRCVHWSGACGMGFPDPVEEGPGAAQWCSCFAVD